MTDEQNQLVLRAFATAADPAPPLQADATFVAAVATGIRHRRRVQRRLRLFAVGSLLLVAAALAPLVASAGVWFAASALRLASGAAGLAASPAVLVTVAALVFALVFPAGVVVWAFRRR